MHDNDKLRQALGSFMTGVTVVTTADSDNTPIGFTANSFTSVSMNPPLLLVCPGKHIASYDEFCSSEYFAVSVLAEGQEEISNNFASSPEDRFANIDWHHDTHGVPLLSGACATFSCRVHNRHEAGDHMILVGEITDFAYFDKPGLGYSSNGYFSLSKEQQADTSGSDAVISVTGAIIKYENKVLLIEDDSKLALPCIEQQGRHGAKSALQQWLKNNHLQVELGPVYSIYDDTSNGKHYTFFLVNALDTNTGKLGSFKHIDDIDLAQFADKALTTMMTRFATEVRHKVFGLYIGDVESGDVLHD